MAGTATTAAPVAAKVAVAAKAEEAVATRRTPVGGPAAAVENPVAVTAAGAAVRRTPGAGPAAVNPAGATAGAAKAEGAARASSAVPSAYAAV
ncbi:hypothetical protein ACLQ18_34785 [Streptomyces sp. DT193]|uniref:hypothetical protein n=1 Tax=Streptomyces sp. DT193 TaxID=3393418 RepID=UPI003CF4860A